MVRFLLENSLGAWWAARHPESPLIDSWEYLRRLDDGTPAAGTFPEWPTTAAEVTVMDPCCGSGHFLVAMFGMLWRMRAEEEGLSPAAAQDAVLRENLYGLELDPRCTQIATFNVALEAWKQGGFRDLPGTADRLLWGAGAADPRGMGSVRWRQRRPPQGARTRCTLFFVTRTPSARSSRRARRTSMVRSSDAT